MRRATKVLPPGSWTINVQTGAVRLCYADRHRPHTTLESLAGEKFLLDLEKSHRLADGEGLAFEDGGIFAVIAADEAVADIHTSDAAQTARIAWHIGQRQFPVQVLEDGALRIPHDPALIAIVEGLGAHVHANKAPFEPLSSDNPHKVEHGHAHCGHSH